MYENREKQSYTKKQLRAKAYTPTQMRAMYISESVYQYADVDIRVILWVTLNFMRVNLS